MIVFDRFEQDARMFLVNTLGADGQQIWDLSQTILNEAKRMEFLALALQDAESVRVKEPALAIAERKKYKWMPVGIREFMFSPQYLNKEEEIYPEVMRELEEMNSGKYDEVVLTGGIGSAKTSCALYSQAYQVYLLSCLQDPHKDLGLDRSSEIKLIFQSINAKLARGVDYNRFRSMLSSSPYFATYFPFDQDMQSIIKFPNRIEVEPIAGVETGAIGQNVIGGIIDEVNFMAMTENSKLTPEGGTYDQAMALYNTIARRRKSRFMQVGKKLPGLLCLVSSRNIPGQFTDIKEAEAKTNPRIYVYDKRAWDIKPEGTYSGKWFHVFIGDEHRKPRILMDGETVSDEDRALVDQIPTEYKPEFEFDINKALKDIAGKSTLAIHPYMPNRELVIQNFDRRKNVFAVDDVDFVRSQASVRSKLIRVNPQYARWVHIDLGLTSDSAGIVIGHVPRFVGIDRGHGFKETLPQIEIDGVLEVKPPMNGEIDFASIRRILYRMRDMGFPLMWVSFDSFQSADSMQILRQQGFTVGYESMDTSMVPYDLLKQALYDGRLVAPKHDKLMRELLSLERNYKKNKIDHTAKGSKDLSDALAGVVYGLCTRREIWAQHSVNPVQATSMMSLIAEMQGEKKQK